MSQTKAELIKGLNINASAPATALNIDSSGRVGIGTTSPGELLHLNGASAALQIQDSGATNSIGKIINSSGILYVQSQNNTSHGQIAFRTSDGSAIERARIDSSGRLLVGTSTARSNTFNAAVSQSVQIEGTTDTGRGAAIFSSVAASSGSYLVLGHQRSGTLGGNTILDNNDEIGTVTFQGNDGTDFVPSASITAWVDGTPGANDMPGRLVFSTTADGASSPTERMRITNAGYIKASNTGSYLSATGAEHEFRNTIGGSLIARFYHAGTANDEYGVGIQTANDQNSSGTYFLRCAGSITERAIIRTNGGLANYQANNVNLSDINTKKDIGPAADTWNCIKEWEIVNYRYKDQPDDADLNVGVIAQQVAESCPEVITVFSEAKEAKPAVLDDDGNEVEPPQEAQSEKLGVKEQQMYWMAIKALQEAQVRIETLEAEVAALKVS